MIKFSVVIPTLNEGQRIRKCIAHVRAIDPDVEIIVADGGSEDNTIRIAEDEGAGVTRSEPGRGPQLNAGARHASGSVLLFLHADTGLPSDAFQTLRRFFQDDGVQIGTFRATFDVKHWLLDFYQRFNRFDLAITRYGDQCIVVRKPFFESMGGFPRWRSFEDVRLLQMARRRTRIYSFPGTVTTSARRFLQNGIVRQILRDGWYMTQYLLGLSPERLAANYERTNRNSNQVSLIVFARFPRPGKVKTRLARSLGEEFAAKFYRRCAEHVLKVSGKFSKDVQCYLFYSDSDDVDATRRWAGRRFCYAAQVDGNLGRRMEHAFSTVFGHGAQKTITLATDVPDLSAKIVDDAVRALDSCDVVVGPCYDGGYYLLGMKRLHQELFHGIPWGTEQVLNETLKVVQALGLAVHLLPTLADIDTEGDLRRWSVTAKGDPHHPLRDTARRLDSLIATDNTVERGSL